MERRLAEQFMALKRQIFHQIFSRMNDRQREAVFQVQGPVLILAGAGSGKTTVLVNRIANLVRYGNGYHSTRLPVDLNEETLRFMADCLEKKEFDNLRLVDLLEDDRVAPWNILAITFTNKAAGELKQRLSAMLGDAADDIQASTFHSACVRILRRHIDRLGYKSGFTIYDSDDSLRVIKDCMKSLEIDEKILAPRAALSAISREKDRMVSPEDCQRAAGKDLKKTLIANLYARYQAALFNANALDFDDIINLTVKLLEKNPDLLEYYQNRFRYVMVDEYQDTNITQYRLVSLLAAKHKNLCVVGDDDQSIYKFRGATIENILSFEEQFENAVVIRLEQNYRCTQNILNSANAVIKNNLERKEKTLWTENDRGETVVVHHAQDEQAEANFIATTILENVKNGAKFSDHTVLYRMNAQSNAIEKCFVRQGLPYKIFGGLRFYERKEIKDIIAYLSLLLNPNDTLRLRRVINEPKRGIGEATVNAAAEISENLGIGIFDVLVNCHDYPALSKKSKALLDFTGTMQELIDAAQTQPLDSVLDLILEKTGYRKFLELQGIEGQTRLENIEELKSNIVKYAQENEEPSLFGFLEEVSLYTDIDALNDNDDVVAMMTMHSAKGLEFDNVFIAGTEEGIFPGRQSALERSELEEERRLAYVGITRAKKKLYLTNAAQRMLFGQTSRNKISRFVTEIPKDLCTIEDETLISTTSSQAMSSPVIHRRAMIQAGRAIGVSSMETTKASAGGLHLMVGDRVKHGVFGEGQILSTSPMGNDLLVEVEFDRVGKKKIMANFAKLTKVG